MNDNQLIGLSPGSAEATGVFLTGVIPDMTNPDYHRHIHMGSSGFKLMARSPLHFWTASPMNPEREKREPSRVMLMGTAWHTGIFEPEKFAASYAARPDISPISTVGKLLAEALLDLPAFKARYAGLPDGLSKTSKEGKMVLAELESQGKVGVEETKLNEVLALVPDLIGKELLAADDLADVRAMADAARRHPAVQVLFDIPGGMAETSIFWIDEATGAPCRIRPDYAIPPCKMFPFGAIIDGKSTEDGSAEGFARTCWNSEMYFQAAFYSDGYQQAFGTPEPPVFAWLVQERDKPYATRIVSAPADFVAYGRRHYRPLLKQFAQCLETNVWPGYPTTVEPLDLPAWALKQIQEAA